MRTPARPDLPAHHDATRLDPAVLVKDLRDLLGATLLAERDSNQVVQAWFQGLNPALGDRSPARLLREGAVDEVGPQVLTAARQFAAAG